MTASSYDPAAFYHFDLAKGTLEAGKSLRSVVISEQVATAWLAVAAARGDTQALRTMGHDLARQFKTRTNANVQDLDAETVVTHIASSLALCGWGHFSLERWGDAVVINLTHCPGLPAGAAAVGELLAGIFSELSGVEAGAVYASSSSQFLLLSRAAATAISGRMQPNATVGELLAFFNFGGAIMSTAVSKLEQLLSQIQRRRNTQVTDEEDARPTNVPPAAAAPPSPAAVRAAPVPLMPSPPARVSAPPITSLPELNAFDFPEVTIQNLEVNDVLQEDNETLVEGSYRRSTRPGSPSSQTIAVMGPTQRIEPNLPGASPASTASPLTAQGQQRFGDILQKAFALRAKSS